MSCYCTSCGWGICCCGSMYPDLRYEEKTSRDQSLVLGLAPMKKVELEGAEMGVTPENEGCKCGSNCTCN